MLIISILITLILYFIQMYVLYSFSTLRFLSRLREGVYRVRRFSWGN
jgi:hypothetical protein